MSEATKSPSPRPSRGEGRGEGRQQMLEPAAAPHPNPLPAEERGEGTDGAFGERLRSTPVRAAQPRGFEATKIWIFDLDNTLYPAECNLFAQVDQRMGEFIQRYLGVPFEYARHLQKSYYRQFGTTLSGMMLVHRMDPEAFLDYVHDIDLAPVNPHPELRAAIDRLPGRKLIFTNGSRRHAERVAGKLGVLDLFEGIFDIQDADYVPKPTPACYDVFLKAHDVAAASAAMFEDMPHNLEAPHALGMTTVLVHSATTYDHPVQHAIRSWQAPPDHVHHMTDDLARFLERLAPNAGQMPTSREP